MRIILRIWDRVRIGAYALLDLKETLLRRSLDRPEVEVLV